MNFAMRRRCGVMRIERVVGTLMGVTILWVMMAGLAVIEARLVGIEGV